MSNLKEFTGQRLPDTEPEWQPLLDLVGPHLTGAFMWMGAVRLDGDGAVVHAYKHRDTRNYLHIDATGRAFGYHAMPAEDGFESWYTELPAPYALAGVFWEWPTFGADDDDLAEVERAIAQTHQRLKAA